MRAFSWRNHLFLMERQLGITKTPKDSDTISSGSKPGGSVCRNEKLTGPRDAAFLGSDTEIVSDISSLTGHDQGQLEAQQSWT